MTDEARIPTNRRDDRRITDGPARAGVTYFISVLYCWAHEVSTYMVSSVRSHEQYLIDCGLWLPTEEPQVFHPLDAPDADALTQRRRKSTATQAATHRSAGIGFSSYTPQFLQFWEIYPQRKDKRKAAAAFERALQRAPLEVILAGARSYRDDPDRKPEFTKWAEGWLNGDRWLDEAPAPAPLPRNARYGDEVDYEAHLRSRS